MKRSVFTIALITTALALSVTAAVGSPPAVKIYVSPAGDDANAGTKQRPFATLARARDAVRRQKTEKPKEDVTIFLRGGIYRLTEPVVFTLADSGSAGQTITYAAFPGETPILCSDVPIKDVDQSAGLAHTTVPAPYRFDWRGGAEEDSGCWIENVLAVLDEPGEWVVDRRSDTLYLWPPDGEPGDDIVAPALTELIRVEGNIDYQGPKDVPVTNLVFRSTLSMRWRSSSRSTTIRICCV